MSKEIMEKLQAPFEADEIEWRVGSTNADKTKGLALAYITNRAIQNRLDDVFGCFGWQNEFKEWKGNSQICGISVWDREKEIWITKWDGADDSQTEAIKGGLSDSMKRAAYQWGIGRYLYKLPQTWVEIEPCGKSYKIKKVPTLPGWALPNGEPQGMKNLKETASKIKEITKISKLEAEELDKMADKAGADKAKMLEFYKVDSFNEMTVEQFINAKQYLSKKKVS